MMKIKFADGTIKNCSAPMEQKLFKNVNGESIGAGWILIFSLIGEITSGELDVILTTENVRELEFITEESTETSSFVLSGYDKISSSTIRYAEDTEAIRAEIQLSKGV